MRHPKSSLFHIHLSTLPCATPNLQLFIFNLLLYHVPSQIFNFLYLTYYFTMCHPKSSLFYIHLYITMCHPKSLICFIQLTTLPCATLNLHFVISLFYITMCHPKSLTFHIQLTTLPCATSNL